MAAMTKKGASSWVYEPEPKTSAYEGEFGSLEQHIEPLADVDLSEVELVPETAAERVTVPPDIFESEHPQMAEAMQFAKLYGELRRVRDELKVMTEDRDEWIAMAVEREDELQSLRGATGSGWQGDEGKVLSMLSRRLELGEAQYGALDVHDDRDKVREAIEEALDMSVYLATKLVAISEAGE